MDNAPDVGDVGYSSKYCIYKWLSMQMWPVDSECSGGSGDFAKSYFNSSGGTREALHMFSDKSTSQFGAV